MASSREAFTAAVEASCQPIAPLSLMGNVPLLIFSSLIRHFPQHILTSMFRRQAHVKRKRKNTLTSPTPASRSTYRTCRDEEMHVPSSSPPMLRRTSRRTETPDEAEGLNADSGVTGPFLQTFRLLCLCNKRRRKGVRVKTFRVFSVLM
ncbi:hypothetical protein DQ04_05091070 [Trypanosoma grayi]|uniref:hypothetical protein n=1 Tax=Trypanosoma grayi TaxID=71804 RepID=UPI0004F4B730|nr:hypothetical protein DQ04_05091070 [Trypanosoma grayi]KEG09521.1 hypothetical protein DQ04_05091070 [Trypanosoma grayi]